MINPDEIEKEYLEVKEKKIRKCNSEFTTPQVKIPISWQRNWILDYLKLQAKLRRNVVK